MPAAAALQLEAGGDLVGPHGSTVLRELAAGASLRPHSRGVVVGLACSGRQPASLLDIPLGKLPSPCRFLALSKAKQYWMVPAWGATAAEVPVETQLLLLELGGGSAPAPANGQIRAVGPAAGYALLLPLIDGNRFRASLRPVRCGRGGGLPLDMLLVRMESGDEFVNSNTFANTVYIQVGTDPYELLDQGIEAAVKLSGSGRMRWEKPEPPTLDLFGWCTWDGLWTDVCPKGIQEGLRHLSGGGTPARLLVIDDGWQQTDVDPQLRAAAEEGMKPQSKVEVEVDYNLMRLVSGEDEQVSEPLHQMKEEMEEWEQWEAEAAAVAAAAGGKMQNGAAARGGAVAPAGGCGSPAGAEAAEQGFGWLGWAQRHLKALLQRCEVVAIGLVRGTVETAPTGSLRMRLFAALMAGPLRQAVLRFYAHASCHSRRLLSVKANGKFDHIDSGAEAPLQSQSTRFGEVVREIKKRHGVDYVYCWHAMAGYWSGIMPGAPGAAKYRSTVQYPRPSPGMLEVDASFHWVQPVLAGIGLPDDPRPFHQDLHTYLKESGVDGVKVDVESTLCMFGHSGRGGYAVMGSLWHGSLEDSVGSVLGGHAFNSMCCSTEDLYNMSSTNIARVSEDYYPLIKASHWAHIANSAFVTLMVGAISVPDWDMCQSSHNAAHLHATARAVSGGMIYVSDKIGDHDFQLLRRLVLPDGTTLRCRLPGRPTPDCLMRDVSRDGQSVLKVWNMNHYGGVVGLFNVQGATWRTTIRNYHQHDPSPCTLTARISPADVPRLPAADRYVAYSDALQEVRVLGPEETWALEVGGGGGHDLVAVTPVAKCGEVEVAPVGLINMMNAGGALREFELREEERGAEDEAEGEVRARSPRRRRVTVAMRLRGCGNFLMCSSRAPSEVTVDGERVKVEYDPAIQTALFEVPQGASMDKRVLVWM